MLNLQNGLSLVTLGKALISPSLVVSIFNKLMIIASVLLVPTEISK